MFVVMHLDVDQTPSARGPFPDEQSAVAKMVDMVNEFLADQVAAGHDIPYDVYTDQPARDVTPDLMWEYQSDLTGLPDVSYRHTSRHGNGDLFDRFFIVCLSE